MNFREQQQYKPTQIFLNSNIIQGSVSYKSETYFMVLDESNYELLLYANYRDVGKIPLKKILLKNCTFHKPDGLHSKNTFSLSETFFKEKKNNSLFNFSKIQTVVENNIHIFLCFNQKDQQYWIDNIHFTLSEISKKKFPFSPSTSLNPSCPAYPEQEEYHIEDANINKNISNFEYIYPK
eukprot:gene7828-12302_t